MDNFDLIIDLKQNYIYIKPNEKFNIHRKFLFKSFSYIDRTDIDDSWLISYIYIDTDAYKNGLRLNDKVIAIDGELVKGFGADQDIEISAMKALIDAANIAYVNEKFKLNNA